MRPLRWVAAELANEWRAMNRWMRAREVFKLAFVLAVLYLVVQML